MNEIDRDSTSLAAERLKDFHYTATGNALSFSEAEFISRTLHSVHISNMKSSVFVVLLFALSLFRMMSNSLIASKHKIRAEKHIKSAKEVAYKDSLTGVKSKHAFVEYENAVNSRLQSGEELYFSVAVCDVNGLKQINDNLGHKAGDEFIKNACSVICNNFKHSPVFRIGGDEFVVVLTGEDFENRLTLLSDFNALIEKNKETGQVVIAVGVSDFEQAKDISLLSVFERADELMYERKKQLKGIK